jgi:beta-lactamase regulating signal transducer with metallopeptidase domain
MSDLVSAIDWAAAAILHATWQAALLAVIVFIVCAALRNRLSARWRAALWMVVLARFVVPVVPASSTSLFNFAVRSTSRVNSPHDAGDAPASRLPELAEPSERSFTPPLSRPIQEPLQSAALPEGATFSIPDWQTISWRLARLVWLAGAGVLLLRLAISQARLRRVLSSCDDSTDPAADPALQSLLANCRAEFRLSRSVRLLVTPRALGPAVVGVWRPTIILPQDILQTLSPEELGPVLLHELAHIRRRDMLVHWLAEIARAVHWFNPAAWLAVRQVAALQELACDEAVLARLEPALQTNYGLAILKVAESLRSPSALPAALGAAYGFRLLKERISNISNYRPTSRLGSCLGCLLMGALVATGLTDSISPATYGDDAPHRNPALDSILQAWRRRENQCASVRFEWKHVVHVHDPGIERDRRVPPDRPGEIVTVEQNGSLGLDGDRWAFTLDTVGGNRANRPVGLRNTFDGTLQWHFSGTSAPGRNGSGAVNGPGEPVMLSAYSVPLFLFARLGKTRAALIRLDRAELADESYLINGVKCRMLSAPRNAANFFAQLYVDVDKGCLVRRWETVSEGQLKLTIDLDYVADPQLGWRPAKWRLLTFNSDGTISEETVCTVTKDDFHAKFNADDFTIPYREGTIVEDRTAERKWRQVRGLEVRVGKTPFVPAVRKPKPAPVPGNKSSAIPNVAPGKEEGYNFPINVSGRAVNREGKPVAGATIYLASPRNRRRPLAETKTDASGDYRFEAIELPIDPADTNRRNDAGFFEVFGIADGYAITWRPGKWVHPNSEHEDDSNYRYPHDAPLTYGRSDPIQLDLTFGPPARLRGRVVDDLGKPIPNVHVEIRYSDPGWDHEDYSLMSSGFQFESLNESELVPPHIKTRKTDRDGRFEFHRLPADHRFRIDVHPPGNASRWIFAATHDGVKGDLRGHTVVYSGDFELVFPRPQTVTVRVKYGDTGQAAAKLFVEAYNGEGSDWKTSDSEGRVNLRLPPGNYTLSMCPALNTAYVNTETKITIGPNSSSELIEATIDAAATINLIVRDAENGRPLSNVDFWTATVVSRPDDRRVYGYRAWEVETSISHYVSPRTDRDGRARVFIKPGVYAIGVGSETYPPGYEPVDEMPREITCELGKPLSVEFKMQRARATSGAGR